MRSLTACITLAALWVSTPKRPATAQAQDAQSIVDAMQRKRAERLSGVSNYTVVQTMNGAEAALYFERIDEQPAFRIVPPGEYQEQALKKAGLAGGAGRAGAAPGAAGAQAAGGGVSDLLGNLTAASGFDPKALAALSSVASPGAGGGGFLQRAGGAALGAAKGELQQQLAQKAAQGIFGRLASAGDDSREEAMLPLRFFDEFRSLARLAGREEIDGVQCHLLRTPEITDAAVARRLAGTDEFTVRRISVWVDATQLVPRRALIEGTVPGNGQPLQMSLDLHWQDYKAVAPMLEPFRFIVRTTGMSDALAASDPRKSQQIGRDTRAAMEKMAAMQEMLDRMPPEQRRMAEAQMAAARSQLEAFSEGGFDAVETVTEVKELRVNAGPPLPFGTGTVTVEGSPGLQLANAIAVIAPATDPFGRQQSWAIQLLGSATDESSGVVQLGVDAHLSGVGEYSGRGAASVRTSNGTQLNLNSREGEATVTIRSRSASRIAGEFSFRAQGTRAGTSLETGVLVRGSFDAPVPVP